MEKKWIKELAILMMGAIATTGCPVYGTYPFAMAFFGAIYRKREHGIFLLPAMSALLFANGGVEISVKYGACMIATAIVYELILKSGAKLKTNISAFLMALTVFCIGTIGEMMKSSFSGWNLLLQIFESVAVFSLSIILSQSLAVFEKEKGAALENREMVSLGFLIALLIYSVGGLPVGAFPIMHITIYLFILICAYVYGAGMGGVAGTAAGIIMLIKTGDMTYFGVFCLLGVIVGFFNKIGKVAAVMAYFSCLWILALMYVPFILETEWMVGLLAAAAVFILLPVKVRWKAEGMNTGNAFEERLKYGRQRLGETAEVFRQLAGSVLRVNREDDAVFATGLQLKEAAGILEKISESMLVEYDTDVKKEEMLIENALIKKGYIVKSIKYQEGVKGEAQVTARFCSVAKTTETAKEAAAIISSVLGKAFRVDDGSRTIVSREFSDYTFVEEPEFMMLYASAAKTKNGEEVSGDNFTFTEFGRGEVLLGIVDGMGSGTVAGEESELVIELLEELLKAGFDNEAALKLINSMLITRSEERSLAAIDMAVGDLYTGRFNFVKLGAAATFIKRNRWVEILKSTNYPMGILKKVDYENTVKKLYDGDYIIMVSDGILDAVNASDKEELLMSWISEYDKKNPKEFAKYILGKAAEANGGVAKDDMTVLVAGIWSKKA